MISQFKPSTLFVAIDGARENVKGEKELVNQVSSIYHDIDWECNVHYKINDCNKGAEQTVSSAVSWVLEDNEYCIVLEDDILVSGSFLSFAQTMLERYKDHEEVYLVSASQFTPMKSMESDYVFSIYGHTGFGWATWRRAWRHFSFELADLDDTLQSKVVASQFSTHKAYASFRRSVKRMKKRGVDNCSWDRCWSYVRHRDLGLSIVPKYNLTKNIGIYGLHANGFQTYHRLSIKEDFQVISHPSKIEVDRTYDKYHFETYLHHSFFSKLKSKCRLEMKKMKIMLGRRH